MALDGAQFNDEDYYAEEWSEFANSKKWWKADLTISYPSPNQITFSENSRLYIADHRIKFTTNETLSLPASASAVTFYFYIEIDNINKVYSLKFADSLPVEGDLTTVYNAVFGKYIHTGGALNVSFLEENVNLEERKFVHLTGGENVSGEKSFLSKLYAKASAVIIGTLSVSGLASFGAGLNIDAGTTNLKNTNVTGQIVSTGNILTDLTYYSSNDTDNFDFLIHRKKTGSVNRVIHKHVNSTGDYIIQSLKNGAGSNLLKMTNAGVYTALGNAGYKKLSYGLKMLNMWTGAYHMSQGQSVTLNFHGEDEALLMGLEYEFIRYDSGAVQTYGSQTHTEWRGSTDFYTSKTIVMNAATTTIVPTAKVINLNDGWKVVGDTASTVNLHTNLVMKSVTGIFLDK